MIDFFTRIDTTRLYPPFFARVANMLRALAQANVFFVVVSGLRGYREQRALFEKGRSVTRTTCPTCKGSGVLKLRPLPPPRCQSCGGTGQVLVQTVTNAQPGQSAHNFGIAVDLARDTSPAPGLQPTWVDDAYEPLRLACEANRLEWGGKWAKRDPGHVQLPSFITARQLEPLHRLFMSGGLPAVWAHLDRLET